MDASVEYRPRVKASNSTSPRRSFRKREARPGFPIRSDMGTRARKHTCNGRRHRRRVGRRWIGLLCALIASQANAEDAALHYQGTVAVQAHPSFAARYSGQNTTRPEAESATSVVMDLSGGRRLRRAAAARLQAELARGR